MERGSRHIVPARPSQRLIHLPLSFHLPAIMSGLPPPPLSSSNTACSTSKITATPSMDCKSNPHEYGMNIKPRMAAWHYSKFHIDCINGAWRRGHRLLSPTADKILEEIIEMFCNKVVGGTEREGGGKKSTYHIQPTAREDCEGEERQECTTYHPG